MKLLINYKNTENWPSKSHTQVAKNPKFNPAKPEMEGNSSINVINHKTQIKSTESLKVTSRMSADRILKNRLNVNKAILIYTIPVPGGKGYEKVSEVIYQSN